MSKVVDAVVQKVLKNEEVQKALKHTNPHGFIWGEPETVTELIKDFNLFSSYRFIDAIVETAESDEDLEKLIYTMAYVINRAYSSMELSGREEEIRSVEQRVKMEESIRLRHPRWFERANRHYERQKIEGMLRKRLEKISRGIEREITALLGEEDRVEVRATIYNAFSRWLHEVNNADLTRKQKSKLRELGEVTKNYLFEFLDLKIKEKPVRLYYYKTGNRVSCKVNLNQNGYSYHGGRGKEVRYNRGEDREEYPLIVSVGYIEEFLDINGVRYEDVLVDPRSVDRFYSFEGVVSPSLSPKFVDTWYDYDCPHLYRHEVNKNRHTNLLGMPLPHFTTVLVEASFSSVHVDESLTEEEAEKLIRGREGTRIAKEILNRLMANRLTQDEIDEIEEEVKRFDRKVQEVIDRHAQDVLEFLAKKYFNISKWEGGKLYIDENHFGLDCGFLHVYTTEREYNRKRSILKNCTSASPWMDVRMPYACQSVTLQRDQFNFIQPIVERELGIHLYAQVVLD